MTITVEAVADAPVVTLGCAASDTPAPGSTEIAINSTTAGNQSYAKLAALAGGGFVAVWRSTPQDANSYAVVGRVFDNTGAPTGAEFIVNSNETGSQTFGEVTALADGGFVVTWSDQTGDSDSWGVKEQRFDATGTAVGSETLVNTTEAARQYLSDSAGLVGGGHVAVWESLSGDADAGGIVARVFDAGGTGGTEIAVNSYTTDDQRFAQVAGTSDGGFVVSWGSFGQDGDNWGIYAQRYDASGAAVGAEFQVNDITADSQRYSHVAGLEGGGFVIAYTSQGQDTDGGSVHAQLYDASGTPIGGVVQVNCSEAGTQNYPYIAALDDGGYVITWNSFGTDGDSYGIFAQRYDASGTPVGPETRLSDTSAGSQYNYGLIGGDATAQLSDGNIVTVWDQDINTGEIFARIVSPDALANLEDQPMPVDVTAALVDQDGSESLSVTLSGFPAGATFNLGAAIGSGWLIDGADLALLDTLEMTPPAHWNGSFTLTATGTATEASNGDIASTTASTLLTILPVNDAPQADDQTIEVPEQTSATMPVSTSGQLTASDNDAGDTQTWTAGSFATANGTVTIATDGSFDYTPNFGFLGVDGFSATVTDGAGATDTADMRIEVATESFTSPGGQEVTLDLNADATAGAPVGNVSVNLTSYAAPSINVLFAMDASGSVGSSGWNLEKQAVISAIQTINTQFATTGIDVDIHVFSFGGTQYSIGGQTVPYGARGSLDVLGGASGPSLPGTELQDFDLATQYTQLLNGVSAMSFTAGTTPWALAFAQAEDWFASEADPNAFNLMYFLTDGNPYPSSQNWQTPLQSLQATGADIQAFGVGSSLNQALLDTVDSDGQATPVTNFAALTAALQDSALFPAELVSLDVTLDADGTSLGVIADETNPAVSASSLSVDLALADISGIEQMLGAQNEFGVSAVFDLDGNLATTADQVTLNSVEAIGLGGDAVTVAGTAGNDLLLASTGDDVMTGGDGDDLLIAGNGADTVFGDNGDDRIRGGEGNDALAGGLGSDTFLFTSGDGADSIQDYDAAADAITFDGGLTFGDLTIAQAGTDVTISYGLDMITVVNALAADFVQAEFNFL